ncbi:hypothetical protein FJC89_24380, partial [Escherichia coli]|nr:hypothetical protein [Escherichia coli]
MTEPLASRLISAICAGSPEKCIRSGSSDALLHHRPLRTVRASFPAYGSSLSKPTLMSRFHYMY